MFGMHIAQSTAPLSGKYICPVLRQYPYTYIGFKIIQNTVNLSHYDKKGLQALASTLMSLWHKDAAASWGITSIGQDRQATNQQHEPCSATCRFSILPSTYMVLTIYNISYLEVVLTKSALQLYLSILIANFDGHHARTDKHTAVPVCCNACLC